MLLGSGQAQHISHIYSWLTSDSRLLEKKVGFRADTQKHNKILSSEFAYFETGDCIHAFNTI